MFAPPGEGGSSPDCLPYLVVFLAFNLLRIRDVVRVCQLNIISDVERNAVLHGQWLVTSGNTRGAEVPEVSAPAPQAACHGGELPVNEGRPMCQKGYGAAASRRSRGGGVAMFIREFTGHISHRSAFRQHWQIAASSQVEKALRQLCEGRRHLACLVPDARFQRACVPLGQ